MSQIPKTLVKPPLDEPEAQPPQREAVRGTQTRSWPVSILGLLLLQAVGLFDLGLYFFSGGLGLERSLIVERFVAEPVNALAMGVVFIPLSLLALLAGISFFWMWRMAWLIAMLVQGLSLLTALVLYFNQKPGYVYVIMLYSIFMVIYLNYFEVYAASPLITGLEEEDEE